MLPNLCLSCFMIHKDTHVYAPLPPFSFMATIVMRGCCPDWYTYGACVISHASAPVLPVLSICPVPVLPIIDHGEPVKLTLATEPEPHCTTPYIASRTSVAVVSVIGVPSSCGLKD